VREKQEKLHTIQELSRKLGIPRHTLRFWEKEFEGILVPLRTEGGQRRYTEANIETIVEIQRLKNTGMTLNQVGRELREKRKESAEPGPVIDILADRIAEAVRGEIYRFFQMKTGDLDVGSSMAEKQQRGIDGD
jgi:DNA-binding transcriptional MerR regulator